MKTYLVIVSVFLLSACTKDNHLDRLMPGQQRANDGHVQQLERIIACCPDKIRPGNEQTCADLAKIPHNPGSTPTLDVNGVITSPTYDESNCSTVDETPFWSN